MPPPYGPGFYHGSPRTPSPPGPEAPPAMSSGGDPVVDAGADDGDLRRAPHVRLRVDPRGPLRPRPPRREPDPAPLAPVEVRARARLPARARRAVAARRRLLRRH